MEAVYQYAWQHRLWGGPHGTLCDGRKIRIISPGILNTDAGPDFSNACVECDGVRWHGNVEIHTRASDWLRHGHHTNPAYDNVILHVVACDDTRIKRRSDDSPLPQLVISVPEETHRTIREITDGQRPSQCHQHISRLPAIDVTDWLETLGMERLRKKGEQVVDIYEWSERDWQQTMFVVLARALGFGLNAEPMEMMARSLPLNFIRRHSDNIIQIEALLFGQAGMLDPDMHLHDSYYQYICREYAFLARKYSLRPISAVSWKMARTRPQNFPHRRIAILAAALAGGFPLASQITDTSSGGIMSQPPRWKMSDYWLSHYHFGSITTRHSSGELPQRSLNLILINAVAPYLYAYGSLLGQEDKLQSAVSLLTALEGEDNTLVRGWLDAGLRPTTAFRSQALLHLRKEYCDRQRCRDCRFAHRMVHVLSMYERRGSI